MARVEGERVCTIVPAVALELEVVSTSRKKGGGEFDSGASHRCAPKGVGSSGLGVQYFSNELWFMCPLL
jgi:hypothetical protein